MSNQWYLRNPLVHKSRRKSGGSDWEKSFSCTGMRPLIICRGPIRMETMTVFEEMGIEDFGILLSEKDSITYANALSPELRKHISPSRVHRVQDYTGATKEERNERIAQIVQIARDNDYDSVFAGYGFMAEDVEMVAAMEAAGLNFIGPCSGTVESAGRKDLAKRTALEVGVSVTPGIDNATILTLLRLCPGEKELKTVISNHGLKISKSAMAAASTLEEKAELVLDASYRKSIDLFSVDQLAETLSEEIGKIFSKNPDNRIRLKAIGGGGGKGQRILDAPIHYKGSAASSLKQAVEPVAPLLREVLSEVKATGVGDNKNVLAEINVETVRHLEIQVVGNGDWCTTLGGRDCSVQMNEQKLLEVSVTVEELGEAIEQADDDARQSLETDLKMLKEMEEEASRFGAAVGLDSVSTFECIIDCDRHYFMEMNTRVQVEHRVSELCYSLRFANPDNSDDSFTVDSIVELMVLLARHGERLPKPVRERRQPASLEARMNATDRALKPHAGGVITQWSNTIEGEIRDDQGICLHNPDTDVFMKYHLAGAYDSNIALLLSTGAGRAESYRHMAEILRRTRLGGENLSTNIQFLYGLINWLIGNNVEARPATNFVLPYLTAVGQLKALCDDVDIVYAYNEIEKCKLGQNTDPGYRSAVQDIMMRKASLLERAISRLFAEPHYLSGWLALNQQHFAISDEGVEWLSNPIRVLANLYKYLNMDARDGLPALYAIWDHDDELLTEALDFYDGLEAKLGITDWKALNKALKSKKGKDVLGPQLRDVQAAHGGFQLGLDILSILPYIGKRSGFFELGVSPDLSVKIPEGLRNRDSQEAAFKVLSPPPAISGNEITAPTGGMYYAREAPDRPAFIEAGQHFEAGDPLFIIEVMKMFNKVLAPFAGTVDEILLDTDSTIIKKGQVLFKVTPDEEIVFEPPEERSAAIRTRTDDFLVFTGFK
jgi:acetyl/propionyl-CoA carboxylase alpha subunit